MTSGLPNRHWEARFAPLSAYHHQGRRDGTERHGHRRVSGAASLAVGAEAPEGRAGGGMTARAMGVIFAASFGCFVSVTPTVMTTLGIYLVPMSQDFGWSRSEVAGAMSIVALANAIAYPFVGRLADRIGPRRTVLIGNILLGLSILAVSQVPAQHALFYLLFGIVGGAGALPSGMVIAKLLAEWFDKTRGLWMGFCGGVGNGLGSTAFPLLAAALLAPFGWRIGFLLIGAIVLLLGFPILYFLLRDAPVRTDAAVPGTATTKAPAAELTGMRFREAMVSPRFWIMFSIVPLSAGCLTAMFSPIVPLLTDRGLSLGDATSVIVVFALTTIVVEPIAGVVMDKTPNPRIIAPCYLTTCAGLWMLLHTGDFATLLGAGFLIGVGAGVQFSVLPYLLSRYFGLRELGAISGVAYGGTLFFGAAAPLLLNIAFDMTGSYALAIYGIIAILVYSAAMILTFPKYRYLAAH